VEGGGGGFGTRKRKKTGDEKQRTSHKANKEINSLTTSK
jgi:hypothetical protein